MMRCLTIVFTTCFVMTRYTIGEESLNDDILHPYEEHERTKRQSTVKITHKIVNTSDYETWTAHNSSSFIPVANTRSFVADISSFHEYVSDTHVYGHHTVINNPSRTFSVIEARKDGCSRNVQATVTDAARQNDCLVAQNGGYFDTRTFSCHGNVVSNGKLIQNTGIQNVHFGITSSGSIITGYLNKEDVQSMNFTQLIGGVIWLVRNGTSFVDESLKLEDIAEETGTLKFFADVQSARTAIGHDKQGRIVFVQVDGQTKTRGPGLFGFAKFLLNELGLVNAINLDGGGSATLVLNGTLASYPSDHCKNNPKYRCARQVSTVICAHRATCVPPCLHGTCHDGRCECANNWVGDTCNVVECFVHNCSGHGNCTLAGCQCQLGWHGDQCDLPCNQGSFGINCSQICACQHHSYCDPYNGKCHCLPGYYGALCDKECPPGKYGINCAYNCHCSDSCLCHPETGTCLQTSQVQSKINKEFANVSMCLATNLWNMSTIVETTSVKQYLNDNIFIVSVVCGTAGLLIFSLAANFVFLWRSFTSASTSKSTPHISESSETTTLSNNDSYEFDYQKPSAMSKLSALWYGFSGNLWSNSGAKYQALGTSEEALELNEITPLRS
uniref:N-acetylglucosamine-1-phosphodiester alpha-N-acetylglucosaminidase-like n=1 Tax=Phallusia mammillata TaxID=59560 RepID=A0A6F9DMI4_9ASCI|nr:N-acetylglucosamine-1-phosphodiester alpha-N-acetylglucosaminidase-like [Phallusia mammillata]